MNLIKTSPELSTYKTGYQWVLIPPTLTTYPAAALVTFGDPLLVRSYTIWANSIKQAEGTVASPPSIHH